MAEGLTERQRSVLDFIIRYVRDRGYPPSIREMKAAFEMRSLRGVTIHLDALERKGFIKRERTSRSIKVLRPLESKGGDVFVHRPPAGTVATGEPLLAVENIGSGLPVPKKLLQEAGGAFFLRVRGDGMADAHIVDGDIVVIKPQLTADSGDLVAALVGDEATVKRFRLEDGRAMLVSVNPAYESICMEDGESRLIGKVIALMRNY